MSRPPGKLGSAASLWNCAGVSSGLGRSSQPNPAEPLHRPCRTMAEPFKDSAEPIISAGPPASLEVLVSSGPSIEEMALTAGWDITWDCLYPVAGVVPPPKAGGGSSGSGSLNMSILDIDSQIELLKKTKDVDQPQWTNSNIGQGPGFSQVELLESNKLSSRLVRGLSELVGWLVSEWPRTGLLRNYAGSE